MKHVFEGARFSEVSCLQPSTLLKRNSYIGVFQDFGYLCGTHILKNNLKGLTASVLCGVWTTVIQLLLFLTIGTLKPDSTGECLHSIKVSGKKHNNTFSSKLQDLIDLIIFVFKMCFSLWSYALIYTYKHLGFCHIIKKILVCVFSAKPLRNSCQKVLFK